MTFRAAPLRPLRALRPRCGDEDECDCPEAVEPLWERVLVALVAGSASVVVPAVLLRMFPSLGRGPEDAPSEPEEE